MQPLTFSQDQACATFNFLNAERRMVAAGLIPPTYMQLQDDEDLPFRAKLESQNGLFDLKHGFGEDPSADVPGEFAPLLDNLQQNVYPKLGISHQKKSEQTEEGDEKGDSKHDDSSTHNKSR